MDKNIDIRINNKLSNVKLVKEEGNMVTLLVNGKKYTVDIVKVEAGYSILHKNKSFNVEIIEGDNAKEFSINTLYHTWDVKVVDAETRYLESRSQSKELEGNNVISSPMPGRVVSITVKPGQEVLAGQTLIVVSAMKMESDYKSPKNAIIKAIHVREGDVVSGHQPLITIVQHDEHFSRN